MILLDAERENNQRSETLNIYFRDFSFQLSNFLAIFKKIAETPERLDYL